MDEHTTSTTPRCHSPRSQSGGTPVTVGAVNYGDMMLCYTHSTSQVSQQPTAPTGLPWTMYAVNLNASLGAIGSLLWSKTYTAPSGNFTISFSGADWQTRTFVLNYEETMQWVGYSLTNGAQLWGPTASENALSTMAHQDLPLIKPSLLTARSTAVHTAEYATPGTM